MKNYETRYIELCKDFIKDVFNEKCLPGGGIETNCFWKLAEESGLWIRETYGTAMSKALEALTDVLSVNDENGNYLYTIFTMKQ